VPLALRGSRHVESEQNPARLDVVSNRADAVDAALPLAQDPTGPAGEPVGGRAPGAPPAQQVTRDHPVQGGANRGLADPRPLADRDGGRGRHVRLGGGVFLRWNQDVGTEEVQQQILGRGWPKPRIGIRERIGDHGH
jgi:hypothetical protein